MGPAHRAGPLGFLPGRRRRPGRARHDLAVFKAPGWHICHCRDLWGIRVPITERARLPSPATPHRKREWRLRRGDGRLRGRSGGHCPLPAVRPPRRTPPARRRPRRGVPSVSRQNRGSTGGQGHQNDWQGHRRHRRLPDGAQDSRLRGRGAAARPGGRGGCQGPGSAPSQRPRMSRRIQSLNGH